MTRHPRRRCRGIRTGERCGRTSRTPIGSLDFLLGAPDVRHVVGVQHRMDDRPARHRLAGRALSAQGGARLVEDGGQPLKQRWFPATATALAGGTHANDRTQAPDDRRRRAGEALASIIPHVAKLMGLLLPNRCACSPGRQALVG